MLQRTRHPAWMFLCVTTLVLFSALSALAQVAPVDRTVGTDAAAQQPAAATSAQQALPNVPARPRLHIVPVLDPNNPNAAAVGFAAPAGAHLSYFGGPVISNVHVVQVLYG